MRSTICTPLIIALPDNLANLTAEGLDSGFESFGWLLALRLRDRTREPESGGTAAIRIITSDL